MALVKKMVRNLSATEAVDFVCHNLRGKGYRRYMATVEVLLAYSSCNFVASRGNYSFNLRATRAL